MSLSFNYYFLSERELLDRVRQGDTYAETFTVKKYESAVKKQAKKHLGDKQYQGRELGDFCQDTIITFLLKARSEGAKLLKEGGTIERWLNAFIKYKKLEMWNNQKRAKKILSDLTDEDITDESDDTHRQIEQFAEFEKTITQLDEEESVKFGKGFVTRLYTYRFIQSMSWEEVTNALNEEFPNYGKFPTRKPLTANYLCRSLWNGNYDERLTRMLQSTRE